MESYFYCIDLQVDQTHLASHSPHPTCFSNFISKTRLFYILSLICLLASEDIKQTEKNEYGVIRT